jgi:hypothetical protein
MQIIEEIFSVFKDHHLAVDDESYFNRTKCGMTLDETLYILDLLAKKSSLDEIARLTQRSPVSIRVMFLDGRA